MSRRRNPPGHRLATTSAPSPPVPPLEWGVNDDHNIVLHPTGCTVCANWLQHYEDGLSEEDLSLRESREECVAPYTEARRNLEEENGQLTEKLRETRVKLRETLQLLDEALESLDEALENLQRAKESEILYVQWLLERDRSPHDASPDSPRPRRRQRRVPRRASSPIIISSAEPSPPPSAPPSAPGPAGPSRIEREADGRDHRSPPPVSLIVSPSTTPPSLPLSYLPISDCFNSPTRRHHHHKESPVTGRWATMCSARGGAQMPPSTYQAHVPFNKTSEMYILSF
jgi:hypothetical protein